MSQLQGSACVRNICNWQLTTPLLRNSLGKSVCRSDPVQIMICSAHHRSPFAINWPDSKAVTLVEFWKLTPQASSYREIFWIASWGSTQISDSLQRAPSNPSWTKPGLFFRASFGVSRRSPSMSCLEKQVPPKLQFPLWNEPPTKSHIDWTKIWYFGQVPTNDCEFAVLFQTIFLVSCLGGRSSQNFEQKLL